MKKLKLLLIPLIATLLLSFSTSPVRAGIFDLWEDLQCAADLDCTVQAAATAASNYITHVIVGKDFEQIEEDDVASMLQGEWNQGLAAAVGNIGGLAYSNPPASIGDYIRGELADNILNTPAQAQVTGEQALVPVREIWTRMREISYGLFLLVMIVIGFMIILQKEISPRVVVTFTSALPKILLGLVLITFSFPIIALIIDAGAVLGSQVVVQLVEGIFGEIGNQLKVAGVAALFSGIPAAIMGAMLATLGGPPGAALGVTALSGLILFVIFAVAAIALIGMTIIRLVVVYGWLLVYTIFSPLLLLFGTLPGQEGSITDFFKRVAAKTIVFPVILFLALLGLGFATTSFAGTTGTFISGNFGDLFTGAFTTEGVLGAILGLVMLAAAFKAPSLVDEALGVGGGPKKKK